MYEASSSACVRASSNCSDCDDALVGSRKGSGVVDLELPNRDPDDGPLVRGVITGEGVTDREPGVLERGMLGWI